MAANVVTVWYRANEKGVYEYNHYQDGETTNMFPGIKHQDQTKSWSSGKWMSKPGTISDDKPAKLTILEQSV